MLDQQYRALTRRSRTQLVDDLQVSREPWGSPVDATLVVGAGPPSFTLDRTERIFGAHGEHEVLDEVRRHLVGEVAPAPPAGGGDHLGTAPGAARDDGDAHWLDAPGRRSGRRASWVGPGAW